MPRPTAKISTLRLKTRCQIVLQNVPKNRAIQIVPRCLAKQETVNLVSGVLEDGQSKTQNLQRMISNLVEGVDRVRNLGRVVRVVRRLLRSDLGRARGLMQGLASKIYYFPILCCIFWRTAAHVSIIHSAAVLVSSPLSRVSFEIGIRR